VTTVNNLSSCSAVVTSLVASCLSKTFKFRGVYMQLDRDITMALKRRYV